MKIAFAVMGIMLGLSGCYTPSLVSRSPFDGSVVGFSYAALSPGTYRVMYVGRWGAKPQAVRAALERGVRRLCSGAYSIENAEEIITVVSEAETEGGVSVRALAKCLG